MASIGKQWQVASANYIIYCPNLLPFIKLEY